MQIKNIIDHRKKDKKSQPRKEVFNSNKDVSDYLSDTLGVEIKNQPIKKETVKNKKIEKAKSKVEELKITNKEVHSDFPKVGEFTNRLYVGQYEIKSVGQLGLISITYTNGKETGRRVIKEPTPDLRIYGNKIKK